MKNRPTFFLSILVIFLFLSCDKNSNHEKPNFLWITCEDITTMLGSYGDPVALTPHLDKFASNGIQFNNAFATAPVCSPSRSCLVTGVFATSLGTQNLRSEFAIPSEIRTLPHILRDNGYYCTNNSKEDYNFNDSTIWDESSKTAHWRNRAKNQPFYSVFNIETTHQSQIFGDDDSFHNKYGKLLPDDQRHKPEDIELTPYFFDTPEVRKLWARYYDLVTIMDGQVADILAQLNEDGLADNTIVFYFSDHGTGMPRSKRALNNSGVQVPFIVHVPEKFQDLFDAKPGTKTDDIVSFVDFPPTILAMAGLPIPDYMQGTSFTGDPSKQNTKFAFATSDRVDEAFELSRTVKSKKYSYIRNFLPHQPLIQPNYYSDKSEIMKELYRVKELTPYKDMTVAQQSMWHPRRFPEELYDLESDPHEINNLAFNPDYRKVLIEMREALKDWMIKMHDSGLVPEGYLIEHTDDNTAYDITQRDELYPVNKILEINELILDKEIDQQRLTEYLSDDHELNRYWAAISLHYVSEPTAETLEELKNVLNDNSLLVRLAAAETLCSFGRCSEHAQQNILSGMLSENEAYMLYASRIFELNKQNATAIQDDVKDFYQRISESSSGKWKGYDLYSCWSLTQAFNDQ